MKLTKNKKYQYSFFSILFFYIVFNGGNSELIIQINFLLLSCLFFFCLKDKNYNHNSESFWFGEDQGRYLVCTSKNKEIEELAESNKIKITNIATINLSDRLTFSNEDYISISELDVKHKNWFKNFMS